MPFPFACSPRREAPRTLRERLECSEGGDTGRRTRGRNLGPYRGSDLRPSVQPPAGVERKAALYAAQPERQASSEAARPSACILDHFREPHGEFDTLTQLLGSAASARGRGGPAKLLHSQEDGIEALLEQLLAERLIAARTRGVGIGTR